MKIKYLLLALALGSCSGLSETKEGGLLDFIPPRLKYFQETEGYLSFHFDEPLGKASWEIEGEQPLIPGEITGSTYGGDPGIPLAPGKEYRILLEVEDIRGNRNTLIQQFYPANPRIPQVVITEACINGSTTRPDMVELCCWTSGNLAGLEIRDTTPEANGQSFIFPSLEVQEGDRILVHFKNTGTPEEASETSSKAQAKGLGFSDLAWDFWLPNPKGLVGTNGMILLLKSPRGTLMDALVYSNRTSGSDEKYGGFGSKAFQEGVSWVHAQGGWIIAEDRPRPEDCVVSTGSTSTRPLARKEGVDTHGREDWILAAKPSFGEPNPGVPYVTAKKG